MLRKPGESSSGEPEWRETLELKGQEKTLTIKQIAAAFPDPARAEKVLTENLNKLSPEEVLGFCLGELGAIENRNATSSPHSLESLERTLKHCVQVGGLGGILGDLMERGQAHRDSTKKRNSRSAKKPEAP